MFNALRDFVRQIGQKPEAQHYSDDDKRLALAALLVHCTAIDGVVDEVERDKLRVLLADEFGLADDELEMLVSEAIAADNEAVDLYRFTSVLTRIWRRRTGCMSLRNCGKSSSPTARCTNLRKTWCGASPSCSGLPVMIAWR